jgi:uncharacterized repeat protein (TIGR01451 family)
MSTMELFFCGKRGMVAAGLAAIWITAGTVAAAELGGPKPAPRQAAPATELPGPQLELSVTGPQKAAVGSRVTFELVVSNVGRTTAAKLLVIDNFDPGLTHEVAASPIEHDLKDLRPGESQRLRLSFRVTRPGKLTHLAQVTQDGKVITGIRSTLTAEGVEPPSGAKEPQPKSATSAAEKPAKTAAKAKSPKMDPDDDFPEIVPRDEPPKEDKVPDLGPPLVDAPENLKRLNDKYPVWIDRKQKSVILVGAVCQRQVPLELFACLRASKEHESVLSIPTKAAFVHAALLAVGAEAGAPVQFRPKYVPAGGSEIEITCVWKDARGKRETARAQDWVRNAKTGKAMEHPWVFGGSRFVKNPVTGDTYYQADADGDLICVSNFPGAMLDLPIESSSADADRLFEAFTEHIPPRGTPVTLILTPKPRPKAPEPSQPTKTEGKKP